MNQQLILEAFRQENKNSYILILLDGKDERWNNGTLEEGFFTLISKSVYSNVGQVRCTDAALNIEHK